MAMLSRPPSASRGSRPGRRRTQCARPQELVDWLEHHRHVHGAGCVHRRVDVADVDAQLDPVSARRTLRPAVDRGVGQRADPELRLADPQRRRIPDRVRGSGTPPRRRAGRGRRRSSCPGRRPRASGSCAAPARRPAYCRRARPAPRRPSGGARPRARGGEHVAGRGGRERPDDRAGRDGGLGEARHERDAEARGHERHRRVEVERPVLERRREAGRGAAADRDVVARRAVRRADERLAGELGQVDLGARGERVVRRAGRRRACRPAARAGGSAGRRSAAPSRDAIESAMSTSPRASARKQSGASMLGDRERQPRMARAQRRGGRRDELGQRGREARDRAPCRRPPPSRRRRPRLPPRAARARRWRARRAPRPRRSAGRRGRCARSPAGRPPARAPRAAARRPTA